MCKPLREYSWLISEIKSKKEKYGLEQATVLTINRMPENFEIKTFLRSHMVEVIDMMLAEDQEINALDLVKRASKREGIEQGIEQGIEAFIIDKIEDGVDREQIIIKLIKRFKLTQEKAEDYYEKFSF